MIRLDKSLFQIIAVALFGLLLLGLANILNAGENAQRWMPGTVQICFAAVLLVAGWLLGNFGRARAKPGKLQTVQPESQRSGSNQPSTYGRARYAPNGDLVAFLETTPRDPGLWHCMAGAVEAPADCAAAFWIMSQPECDQATVSNFIKAHDFKTEFIALRSCDRILWADQIGAVLDRWAAGFYTDQRFFSYPADDKTQHRFRESNAFIAKALGRPSWPVPEGLFKRFDGTIPDPDIRLWDD